MTPDFMTVILKMKKEPSRTGYRFAGIILETHRNTIKKKQEISWNPDIKRK